MRKPLVALLALVVVGLLAATVMLVQDREQAKTRMAEMKSSLETTQQRYADAFRDIAEIQDSLNALPLGNGPATLIASGSRGEAALSGPDRQQALARIAEVNSSIARAKERIQVLEKRVHSGSTRIAGLERTITNLKAQVADKEQVVAQLTTQVNALQGQVAGLQTTVERQQDSLVATNTTLEERQHELGTVYYLVGSKQQLTRSGVIVARGGVLGLGRTVQLSGRFDESQAVALDTDAQTTIDAPAKHVQLLSPQPQSSYQLVAAGEHTQLRIVDPREFRKVRHVVIMTD